MERAPGGGLTPSALAAAKFGNDLYVFVRGTDDRIYQTSAMGDVEWMERGSGRRTDTLSACRRCN